jgi:hypothetical protein
MNNINLNENIKAFENKLTTYIDVYNITYTNNTNTNTNTDKTNINDKFYLYDDADEADDATIIHYTTIKLEKIGNLELLYNNFSNINKELAKQLGYSIHQDNFWILFEKLDYILYKKHYIFNFKTYHYELYNVIGVDDMYVIKKNVKGIIKHFEKPCIIFIFIRDRLFIHNY